MYIHKMYKKIDTQKCYFFFFFLTEPIKNTSKQKI